jgi:hypothetical protein
MTTTMCISELNDAAYTLAPSGFAPPLLASTRTSLLACSLDFDQVGLGHNCCPHPVGNNNEFHALTLNPNASDLARRDLIHTHLKSNLPQDIESCLGRDLRGHISTV